MQWTALRQGKEESFDAYRARVAATLALLTRAKQHVSTEQHLYVLTDRLEPQFKAATLALKNGAMVKDVRTIERVITVHEAQYNFDAIAAFLNAHERAVVRADAELSNEGEYTVAATMSQRRAGSQRNDSERQPPWETQPCWTCGKVGHPARRCPKGGAKTTGDRRRDPRDDNDNERADHDDRRNDDDDIAACCTLADELPGRTVSDEQWSKLSEVEQHAAFSAARQWAREKQQHPTQWGAVSPDQPLQQLTASASSNSTRTAMTRPESHTAHARARKHELKRGTGPTLSIDTMSSYHCTNDEKLFTGPLRTVAPVRLRMANRQTLEVTRVGSVRFSVSATRVGSTGKTYKKGVSIKDVYYHPLFSVTLISWGKLRELGWRLRSEEDSSEMTTPTGWRIPLCNYGKLLMLATDEYETTADKREQTAISGSHATTRRDAAPEPRTGGARSTTEANEDGWTQVTGRRHEKRLGARPPLLRAWQSTEVRV